jgi:hypothetical protein
VEARSAVAHRPTPLFPHPPLADASLWSAVAHRLNTGGAERVYDAGYAERTGGAELVWRRGAFRYSTGGAEHTDEILETRSARRPHTWSCPDTVMLTGEPKKSAE